MTREQQGKDKNKQQLLSQQAVHKAQDSRLDQRSYIDQIRSHQDPRSFQEQMRNQEKRSQSDSLRSDDPARYSHPASQATFHHDQARTEPNRSQLDAFAQYSQVKTDKPKVGRAIPDPISPDLRQRVHQEQKHQQEPKKLVEQFKALTEHNQIVSNARHYGSIDEHNQYQVEGKTELSKELEESSIQKQPALKISPGKPRQSIDQYKPLSTSPQHKHRSSPKHEKTNFSSCRLEQQQSQHKSPLDQVYGIPSATPADKLPGFVPSVAHCREQKRQSFEGHHDSDVQKKDRDTPASIAGSDGSHTSAPTGIPNELLDSVLETAKLPVWRPPDKSDIKIPSPAKPTQASPPKPEPVISERDTSALEELVKHIDASPSHKEHRLDKSASPFTTPLQPCKSGQDNLEIKSNPLVYSNISGHLGSSVTQSDKDTSDADRSDYDFDSHDKGGVDYDDEEDLPIPPRRKDTDPSSTPKGTLDISTWNSEDKGSPSTNDFEKVTNAPRGGTKSKEKAPPVYNKLNELKPKNSITTVPDVTETLTKRGTKVPCYKEKDPDLEGSPSRSASVKKAAPANIKGKAKGKGGSRMFGRKSGPKYDQKAFEKVHKNLAGTDFDFEDEFDDDVGFIPKEDVPGSLKDFRQQTKSKKVDSFDFDDSENSGVSQMPPVLLEADDEDTVLSVRAKPPLKIKKSKNKTGKKVNSSPTIVPKIIPLKIKKMEEKPKIPKIKIKIGNRTDSPDDKSGAKRKRKVSSSQNLDDFEAKNPPPLKLKIPTLKIKLPPKPVEENPEKLVESDLKASFEQKAPTAVIIRTTPKASPSNGKLTPAQPPKDILDDPDIFDLMPPKQDFSLESLKSDFVKSSPRALIKIKSPAPNSEQPPTSDVITTSSTSDASPKKVKGTIDFLANKLLAKQQSNSLTSEKANELAAIFGPEEPLSVNIQPVSESSVAVADKTDDGPSELDLLALELKKLENDKKELEARKETTPEKLQEESVPDRYEEDPQNRLMSMKYKLKPTQDIPRNTTSPGPNTPVKISLMSSADPGQRRMRKKELLNSYFGIETPVQQPPLLPPVIITNGPVETPKAKEPILPILPVRMNIIKIPKAVASVTSVPTRADYQPQLEANMERKRKREGKEDPKVKGQKKGKGKQSKSEEEPYRPKLKKTQEATSEQSEAKERRTRGMPPKKCFEESPEREGPLDSFKKSYMRYGEEMFKKFEEEPKAPTEKERRKKDKKRRREDDEKEPLNSKTPRIVIKFSKTKEQQPKDSSGLKPILSQDSGNNIPKLKIKPPVK